MPGIEVVLRRRLVALPRLRTHGPQGDGVDPALGEEPLGDVDEKGAGMRPGVCHGLLR
ncbi:hypothetical protein [Streptomyces sp. NBC_01240]|uniref:hypothetical protein n=1 Tax=Streptomyces sp. NBC_01240 TaxID=2903793 RepID=UPI002255EBFF|nr:hypothetical protein [Streptomyces sp. NBC_01240]MCX4790903.1 hypothetical protein [Streptomyces sp. NBC_01221]WSP61250.1 hypothetical protein OG466_04590 [Streptomyces sp. NBC_01240]